VATLGFGDTDADPPEQRRITLEQVRETVRRSRALVRRCQTLLDTCEAAVTRALEACETSRRNGSGSEAPPVACVFYLRGMIAGEPVLAIWRDAVLACHPLWEERAELLVRMGETFEVDGHPVQTPAGLDEPLQAALTLMRAADDVVELRLELDDFTISYPMDESTKT
jgi:hypothetical protein